MNPLFAKLAAAEKQFFDSEFLSPVIRGRPIRVRIAGIVLTLKVNPEKYEGWGVFHAVDQKTAKFIKDATLTQKQEYLELCPRFSFVLTRQSPFYGILANKDNRVQIVGQVPILLAQDVRLFDTVDARFDGENFWFDSQSSFRSPRTATVLRDLLAEEVEPDKIEVDGLTADENLAYQIAFQMEIEAKKDRKEERIRKSLERGGALLRSYVERGNTYTIEFTVDGQRHRSVIDSSTLEVASAGICLSGYDRHFDLQSLVGVLKEGHRIGRINRVGNYDLADRYDDEDDM